MPGRSAMNHRERILGTLLGVETDRLPVSMWRHFFCDENTIEGLVAATLRYQRDFDWDFVKVNPRASYHVEDWGVRTSYSGNNSPRVIHHPIVHPSDWSKISVIDHRQGVLGAHLGALESVRSSLGKQVPFVMTVFNPISIASRLTSSEELFAGHIKEYPSLVIPALEAITETFIKFAIACVERGASGVFFATTAWATRTRLSEKEYREIARPFDLRVLQSVAKAEFNILHVCRDNNLLPVLADYPVHAINWDVWGNGNLSITEAREVLKGKIAVGGVPNGQALVEAAPEELSTTIRALRHVAGTKGWMLGPGCTYNQDVPVENIRSVRNSV